MKACIIGAGVTGLSLLLLLIKNGIEPSDITIIDPYFNCGDLVRKWGNIQSNTPWAKTTRVLNQIFALNLPETESTTLLSDIGSLFLSLTDSIPVQRIKGFVTEVSFDSLWTVTYISDTIQTLQTTAIFLAQGSEPKILNLPIPSIPLECALDSRIRSYVNPDDYILLFGTMHSGTIVMKQLHDISANITAVYHSRPFAWARDGVYDGIKEESAHIADAIVRGEYRVTLIPASDVPAIIRAAFTAKWVIYAIGFTPRIVPGAALSYSPTGEIGVNAWGFGIAYPNAAPDGIHWDVGVAAFLNHINAQMPSIVRALG